MNQIRENKVRIVSNDVDDTPAAGKNAAMVTNPETAFVVEMWEEKKEKKKLKNTQINSC